MHEQVFHIRQGDTLPNLKTQLSIKGEEINLGLAIAVKLRYAKLGAIDQVQERVGSVVSGNQVMFEWDEPFEAGMYRFFIQVTFAGGKLMTFPNRGFGTIKVSGVNP